MIRDIARVPDNLYEDQILLHISVDADAFDCMYGKMIRYLLSYYREYFEIKVDFVEKFRKYPYRRRTMSRLRNDHNTVYSFDWNGENNAVISVSRFDDKNMGTREKPYHKKFRAFGMSQFKIGTTACIFAGEKRRYEQTIKSIEGISLDGDELLVFVNKFWEIDGSSIIVASRADNAVLSGVENLRDPGVS